VLEDGLIRLAVFRRRRTPRGRAVVRGLLCANVGEVPLDVAISATAAMFSILVHTRSLHISAHLPRGVVRPMPLYMTFLGAGPSTRDGEHVDECGADF
jgi:hypothetical protein